jgi:hypothetical protein
MKKWAMNWIELFQWKMSRCFPHFKDEASKQLSERK